MAMLQRVGEMSSNESCKKEKAYTDWAYFTPGKTS